MNALGMIETRGLVACVEAADAATEAAVASAMPTSCDSGAAAAQKVGELIAVHVIPQPHPDLEGKMPISLPEHLSRKK